MMLELVRGGGQATLARLDPAMRALLDCARTRMSLERTSRLHARDLGMSDAERLLSLAVHHGLVPLVNLHLGGPQGIVDVARHRLRELARESATLNQTLYAELHELLDDFDAAAIPVVPFRGPALAVAYYGNVGLREFRDLDLLVRREDVLRIKPLLLQRGYTPEFRLSRAAERIHLREATDYTFGRRRGRGIVEIHWALLPKYLSPPMEAAYWQRLVPRVLGHRQVRALSTEDLLVYLCAHGAKHAWSRLVWLVDIAESLRVDTALDWDRFLLRARALSAERVVRLGLLLAHEYLEAPVPEELVLEFRADAGVARLAVRVAEAWGAARPWRARSLSAFHLATRDSWLDSLRYVALRATSLNANDWGFVALPESLIGLYYPLRLVRLAGEAVHRLAPAPNAAGGER